VRERERERAASCIKNKKIFEVLKRLFRDCGTFIIYITVSKANPQNLNQRVYSGDCDVLLKCCCYLKCRVDDVNEYFIRIRAF
jgi:hypothetical protein